MIAVLTLISTCALPIAARRTTTCMRHLVNTFIDGGEKSEKEYLGAKLKDSLATHPEALRLSADITKLFRALAKGIGEGIELYAKGEGAKSRG